MKKVLFVLFTIAILTGCSKSGSDVANGGSYSNDRNPGASANDLLSSAKYESLKIEVQYMAGFPPDAAAITQLTGFLSSLVNKPGGIQVVQKEISPVANTSLSLQDIIAIEKQNRTVFTSGKQLGVYFLYTNGIYSHNDVLGVAYGNTSLCVFGKKVHDNSGGIGQTNRTKLEATVLEHEMGHMTGLVDVGSPMQENHKDAAHEGHCSNTSCLMYYLTETSDMAGMLLTAPVPALDAACLKDLKANGGK
jgi:Prokaryotic membrane lipoprotein lipid attachment site